MRLEEAEMPNCDAENSTNSKNELKKLPSKHIKVDRCISQLAIQLKGNIYSIRKEFYKYV